MTALVTSSAQGLPRGWFEGGDCPHICHYTMMLSSHRLGKFKQYHTVACLWQYFCPALWGLGHFWRYILRGTTVFVAFKIMGIEETATKLAGNLA